MRNEQRAIRIVTTGAFFLSACHAALQEGSSTPHPPREPHFQTFTLSPSNTPERLPTSRELSFKATEEALKAWQRSLEQTQNAEVIPTPSPVQKPTSTPNFEATNSILLENKRPGEFVELNHPTLEEIKVFSVGNRSFVVALLSYTPTVEGVDKSVYATQADCLINEAKRTGNLPRLTNGNTYDFNKQIEQINGEVKTPIASQMPYARLEIQSIQFDSQSPQVDCKVPTLSEEAKDKANQLEEAFFKLIEKVPWNELPSDIGSILGEITGDFSKSFWDSFKSKFFLTKTPTR